ncbi:MAG: large conductance mechanosensitive channel protein MscL [Fimbriimonas sp.]
MSIFREFREFAVKGNVIDLAVGVIIGAAFGKIVTSIVEDLIMPPLGMILGKVDFKDKFLLLPGQDDKVAELAGKNLTLNPTTAKANGISVLAYGNFLNQVVQFLIVAFAVFLLVKAVNRARQQFEKPAPVTEPVTKQCPLCLSDVPIKATKCKFCTADIGA